MAETNAAASVAYTLTSFPPLVASTLLVGVDEEDGGVRAYMGARWKRVHLHVPDPEAENFRRAWRSGGHVWLYPVPTPDWLCVDPKDGSCTQGESRV